MNTDPTTHHPARLALDSAHSFSRTWRTDNRFATGVSGVLAAPTIGARAMYAARWIDQGDDPADILPDRQGFAYNDPADRDALIAALVAHQPERRTWEASQANGGDCHHLIDAPDLQVYVRRAGGYVYVDAWLPA